MELAKLVLTDANANRDQISTRKRRLQLPGYPSAWHLGMQLMSGFLTESVQDAAARIRRVVLALVIPVLLTVGCSGALPRLVRPAPRQLSPTATAIGTTPSTLAAPTPILATATADPTVMSSPESTGTRPVSITPSPRSTEPPLLMPTVTIPSVPTRDAMSPTPQPLATVPGPLAQLVAQGPTDQKVVALTFDAGADRGHAAAILSTLEQLNAPSTFGMTGLWAEANPDLMRRIVADGHQIMNHTNDHQSFTGLSTNSPPLTRTERLQELATADAIFSPFLNHSTKPFFRPPYGDYDESVLTDAFAAGYFEVVNWTVDSGGWRGWDAAKILTHCENSATPGAIYAFHIGSQSEDYAALPALIGYLSGQGYRFTTLAGLLAGH